MTLDRRIEEIFHKVAACPADERPAVLERLCGADPSLRAHVEALLRADADPASLAPPVLDPNGQAETVVSAATLIGEKPGDVIGRYKLLQQIGAGGFGVVFMAEQREPVVRRVALKIIKVGMDTRQVIARFEAERQALAMMEHPNIAKVLDAGATQTGRPYFVMELVRGDPITEYADKHNLSTRDRLELFTNVCHAVQHAHQKGVIHRDIKPSNILVTVGDGRPIPKVIDFGIAKATSARLTEKTLFTEHRALIGTPAYMSPEQAEMSGVDIDTRSDIYSLGVLLYELLTGVTPFDPQQLRAAAWGEMQRIIREVEPPKPSTRLSTMKDTLPTIAAHRHSEPGKLPGLIRGDLDWIVMKCLEKDRTRRYETANGVAMDVQRHLSGEAVLAAPASAGYRLMKFARRHRVGVVAGATVAAALVLGVLGASAGFLRASQEREKAAAERDRAVAAERVALERAKQAEAITKFLSEMLASADPQEAAADRARRGVRAAHGTPKTMRDLLAEACAKLKTSFADQPLVEARLRRLIGRTYRNLGLYEQAEQQLPLALDIYTRLLGETDVETIRSFNELARLRLAQDRLDEAEALNNRTLATARKALGGEHEVVLQAMHVEAEIASLGEEARPFLERLLEIERRVLGEEHPDTLGTMHTLARLDADGENWPEATARLERLLEIRRRVQGDEHPDTLGSMSDFGFHQRLWGGRPSDACRWLERALEAQRRVLGEDHPNTLDSMHQLGHVYAQLGRIAEGLDVKERGLAARRRHLGDDHTDTIQDLGCLADEYRHAGRTAESVPLFEKVLAQFEARGETQHVIALSHTVNLGCAYIDSGRARDAVALLEPLLPKIRGDEWPWFLMLTSKDESALQALGAAYRALGRTEDARQMAVERLYVLRRRTEAREPLPMSLSNYAKALMTIEPQDLRDPAAALPLAERAYELGPNEEPEILATLALAYHLNGDTARAIELQRKLLSRVSADDLEPRKSYEQRLAEFETALQAPVESGDKP